MSNLLDDEWIQELILAAYPGLSDGDNLDEDQYEAIRAEVELRRDELVESYRAGFVDGAHDSIVTHRLRIDSFRSSLWMRWYPAFDPLQIVVGALTEIGEAVNKTLRDQITEDDRAETEITTRTMARAYRIANELRCLVENGFAGGALSRWRSLHELAVILETVVRGGGDTAQRLIDHDAIDVYKAAQNYQKHAEELGLPQKDPAELAELENARQRLIQTYGRTFDSPYGWAAHLIDGKKFGFRTLEQYVGLDHLRPYYGMASQSIHSTSRGIWFDLGMMDGPRKPPLLSTGPSNYGLADPIQLCALSLFQITKCGVKTANSISGLSALEAVESLIQQLQSVAVEIQRGIEAEEDEMNSSEST